MKTDSFNMLFLIWVSLFSFIKWEITTISKLKNSTISLIHNTSLFIDLLLTTDFNGRIRVYSKNATFPSRESIRNKYKDQEILSCFDAINDHTMNLFEDYHKKMLFYSFNDFGDSGNYRGCLELSEYATFNYINANITNLPLDIRSGLCFPKECKKWMMDQAQDPISSTLK